MGQEMKMSRTLLPYLKPLAERVFGDVDSHAVGLGSGQDEHIPEQRDRADLDHGADTDAKQHRITVRQ